MTIDTSREKGLLCAAMRLLTLVLVTLSTATLFAQSPGAKPLVLEKDQGEKLYWRPLSTEPPGLPEEYILKVTPENSGSRHLLFGVEDIEPGGRIDRHHHLEQDEIVFIPAGSGTVTLNDKEYSFHAGATVFIPAKTWVSFKNTGKETLNFVFVFSAPGFEQYMRCESSTTLPTPPITEQQDAACAHKGQVVYQELAPEKK